MPRGDDLTNRKYGRLTVAACLNGVKSNGGGRTWICHCECGNTVQASTGSLNSGNTRSCGCLRTDMFTTHGMAGTPEYVAWSDMKHRCFNPSNPEYRHYGGRGISVCQRWRDSFQNFFNDMGLRPSETHSLDRYPNNDGDYEPGNCRWASKSEQSSNTRRNVYHNYGGEIATIAELATKHGINEPVLRNRLFRGMPIDDAVNVPVIPRTERIYTHNGTTLCLKDWATKEGINYHTLYNRIFTYGWSFEKAIQKK
jgi:hypothetical protein